MTQHSTPLEETKRQRKEIEMIEKGQQEVLALKEKAISTLEAEVEKEKARCKHLEAENKVTQEKAGVLACEPKHVQQ